MERWLGLNLILILTLFTSGCGRIWGAVTYVGGGNSNAQNFSYTCGSQLIHVTNSPVSDAPTVSGVSSATYSIAPPLPAGLSISPTTGIISGTPTAVTGATNYTVTATGSNATLNTTINLRTAQGYLVNDLSDSHNTGGVNCVTAGATCTLRAAIEATNTTGASRVTLLPTGTINLTLGIILTMTQGGEIYGNCQTNTVIDGLSATRILDIQAGPTTLANLTVQNASVFNNSPAGIEVEAPAAANVTTMNNMIIQNNVITGGGSGSDEGAGIEVDGSSLAKTATLIMTNSTFSGNINNATGGSKGGGLAFYDFAQGTLTNITFSGNQSASAGGALALLLPNVAVSISQSLFFNNTSLAGGGEGGAIHLNLGTGNLTATNDTFVSNSGIQSGAIFNQGGGPIFTILNSTFQNNSSGAGKGGALGGQAPGAGSVQNTIFSNNTSGGVLGHCQGSGGFTVTSLGNNLSDDVAGDCSLTGPGDIVSSAAINLGALQNNGGATNTMALSAGSAALNNGATGACPATDQRGAARHLPTTCDIGAYEHQP